MFDKIMGFFKELNTTTMMILVFAAILVIFLIILIVVTVKVLKSANSDEDDEDEYEEDRSRDKRKSARRRVDDDDDDDDEDEDDVNPFKMSGAPASRDDDDEDEDDDEYYDDDEDEEEENHSHKVNNFRSGLSSSAAQRNAEDALKVAEEIKTEVDAVKAKSGAAGAGKAAGPITVVDLETAGGEAGNGINISDEKTNELDTKAIKAALRREKQQVDESMRAASEAVASDYNAKMDSAFAPEGAAVNTGEIPKAKTEGFVLSDEAIESATEASLAAHDKVVSAAEQSEAENKIDTTSAAQAVKQGVEVAEQYVHSSTPAQTGMASAKYSEEAAHTAQSSAIPGVEFGKIPSTGEDKITVNPVNAVNINTVNSVERVDTKSDEAGISGMEDMQSFLSENPVPKKKKKKVKKKDQAFADKFDDDLDIRTGEYFWYNSQDIDGLKRKEDMYYYCHYFNKPSRAIIPLVTEMYDCAFVRTEEIQLIAYGISFKSMKMKDILSAKEKIGFDLSNATKEPSDKDKAEIYRKWCGYVDNFLSIIVINAPDDVKLYIRNALYEYGRKDAETLLYSPE